MHTLLSHSSVYRYVSHPPRLSTCLLVAVYKYRILSPPSLTQTIIILTREYGHV